MGKKLALRVWQPQRRAKMIGVVRHLGPLGGWADGGVAGKSFVGCFGTMEEFGDAENCKRNGVSSLLWRRTRMGSPVRTPPAFESAAADCGLRHPQAARGPRRSLNAQTTCGGAASEQSHGIVNPAASSYNAFVFSDRRVRPRLSPLDNTTATSPTPPNFSNSSWVLLWSTGTSSCSFLQFSNNYQTAVFQFRTAAAAAAMPAGTSRKGVVDAAPPEPSLPKNYTELRAIAEESVTQGRFVDIIGLVKDCRLPIATNGSGELKQ